MDNDFIQHGFLIPSIVDVVVDGPLGDSIDPASLFVSTYGTYEEADMQDENENKAYVHIAKTMRENLQGVGITVPLWVMQNALTSALMEIELMISESVHPGIQKAVESSVPTGYFGDEIHALIKYLNSRPVE